MKLTLPGQCDLPAMPENKAGLIKRLDEKRRLRTYPQLPCDVGLFSDESSQLDLIEMFMEPVNE